MTGQTIIITSLRTKLHRHAISTDHGFPRCRLKRFGWVYPFLLYAAFTLILFSASGVARAQETSALPETATIQLSPEEQAWLKAHPTIRLGYVDGHEPQLIVGQDGRLTGILVDLVNELNRRLNADIQLSAYPLKELLAKAKNGEIDGICNLHPEYADKLGLVKSNGYFRNYPVIFARHDTPLSGPEQIAGKIVAVLDRAHFSQKILDNYPGAAGILKVGNALEGLKSLESGAADIYIGVSHNTYLLSKYQFYDIVTKYIFADFSEQVVMAIQPGKEILAGILSKGLSTFSDGDLNAIVSKWVPNGSVLTPEEARKKASLTTGERNWLAEHPNVELGYTDAFEPEVIVNKDGSYRGILVDVLDLLNQRLGTDFKLVVKPIPDLINQVSDKKLSGVLGIHPHYADKLGWLKTRSYATTYPTIFSRKGFTFNRPSDLAGKKIALIDKIFFSQNLVDLYGDGSTLIKVETALEGLERVKDGTADLYIGSSSNSYLLGKYQFFDLKVTFQFYDYPIPNAMGVRSDWPQLVDILNKGLASIPVEEVESIYRKWISVSEQEKTLELTDEEQTWLAQNHTVRVRGTDQAPYMFFRDGKAVGISADLIRIISEYTGINFHVVIPSPPFSADLQSLIQHTGPDLFGSLTPTQERKKNILFTEPYVSSPKFIFTRDDSVFVSSMTDLSGKTVAVIKGYLVHEALAKNYPDIKLVFYKNNKDALKAVSEGKSFAFIGGLFSTPFMINKYGLKNLRACAPSNLPGATVAMAIRSDWPELRDIINKVFDIMPSGEKAAIVNKWSSVKIEYGIRFIDVLKWIFVAFGTASGIVLVFVFWNRTLQKKVKERTGALEISKKSLEAEISERKRAEKQLLDLKEQLHEENIYLRKEIQLEHNFNEIIGNSAALRYVLFRVEQIAAVNTTALILGETGTGKDLIAHAIHNTSSRKERPLIKVNCATLPAHLIESELFGHEKGAFTGATVQRIGRFELANGATLFLDEIGEMPLELQSKLLRVLQDGEFERVGSSRTIKVDVRLIAATNRDLETEIQSGRFRQDLFYRLNVYSLTLPPLRERPEDIPLLVDAFIKKYNKKLGKRVEFISQKTTDDLTAYSWPGNIRELQNVIEHAVIMAQDKTLHVELPENQKPISAHEPTQTLDEMERDYIQEVLKLKNWRIDGPEGAALVLDLKPSTLRSRMQKLGIKRPS